MAEFLLELLSEEIPARMQARAADDLKRLVCQGLDKAGLAYTRADAFVTPRRLALVVDGLAERQPDVTEERKGPRVGSPEKAVQGFLRGSGLSSVDQAEVRDSDKGQFYFAVSMKSGRPTADVLATIIGETLAGFPWPKSMRWGSSHVSWVRPVHNVLALFAGAPIPLTWDLGGGASLSADATTRGHRFLAPSPVTVTDFADYAAKLRAAKVILDPRERRQIIRDGAARLAAAEGLVVRDDPGLLDEVTGLVEWPLPMLGRIDEAFMDVPAEVLITAMRAHQKYFSLLRADSSLAPRFVLVANTETADGGAAIVAGNERVLRARLSDAKYFWDQDRKRPLATRVPKLAERVFHAKLGSDLERVSRLEALAPWLAPQVGADPDLAARAAHLCKADLMSQMVGEFPELQGIMGRYYALNDGEPAEVADAVAEHYAPKGPGDRCPTAPVSVAVALADKIDTLVGFFAIGEKPTGSGDPFALRRAALGVIRLIIENKIRLHVGKLIVRCLEQYFLPKKYIVERIEELIGSLDSLSDTSTVKEYVTKIVSEASVPGVGWFLNKDGLIDYILSRIDAVADDVTLSGSKQLGDLHSRASDLWAYICKAELDTGTESDETSLMKSVGFTPSTSRASRAREVVRDLADELASDVLKFFADRLKVHLREDGVRHDLVSAVFADGREDDLVRLLARVEALRDFLNTDDGANLLIAYRRASNIVRIEETKDGVSYDGEPDQNLFSEARESELSLALQAARPAIARAIVGEEFKQAMAILAGLRPPVDAFFDQVQVNCADRDIRVNRLKLLSQIRSALGGVADFSQIEG